MTFMAELALQAALISYVLASPFTFLWFHKVILEQNWDNDAADWVTVILYLASNFTAAWISYLIQECQRCL